MRIAASAWTMSPAAAGVLAMSLMIPVVLAVAVFPAPMYDTRELIAWGREFPLLTPDHPPMMVWIGGGVERLFGTSAAVMILCGQLLMGVGLWYFYRLLRAITSVDNAVVFTFLYATSAYTVFAPLSFALNADVLQLVSWPAVVCHLVMAVRTGRLAQWIGFAIWSAIAFLTKYNAVVLFAGLGIAAATVPAYRSIYSSRGFYLAIAAGLVMIAPHVVAALGHRGAVEYGLEHFDIGSPVAERLRSLREWASGAVACAVPGLFSVGLGFWSGVCRIEAAQGNVDRDARRVLLVANITMQIVVLVLITVFGLGYKFRFSPPYVMMAVLAFAPWVSWRPDRQAWMSRLIVPCVGGLNLLIAAVLIIVYTFHASHSGMQEPTRAGADAILADWHRRYACGPGYFYGYRQSVYGVGIEAGRDVTTIALGDVSGAPWFDADRWRRYGAVIIDTPEEAKDWMASYRPNPSTTAEERVSLPLLRTHVPKQFTYSYHFIAPQECPPVSGPRPLSD